jgi:SsrA-binding protein
MAKAPLPRKLVAQNRKARHDYFIGDTFEAGIVLTGTEVKSLRGGGVQITESYADPRGGELWLVNAHIPEYGGGNRFNHEPRRPRKLLLHKREIEKMIGAVTRERMTIVPLELYFNERGRAKLQLGLAKGKTKGDKRETIKERDWKRDKARLMRDRG